VNAEPDRLTIRRALALTAGMAVGLGVLAPDPNDQSVWLGLAHAALAGLSLPAPAMLLFGRRRDHARLSAAQMYVLSIGLGVWTMLPPAVVGRLGDHRTTSIGCLFYVLPLMGLWFLLASCLAGDLPRRLVARESPWTERYAYGLALLWSPLGAWHLANFYWELF
jgi:hypothetical protein